MKAFFKQQLNTLTGSAFFRGYNIVMLLITLGMFYLAYSYSFLLFHTLAEMATVCIAFTVFAIVWNSKQYLKNSYFIFLGVAYLFVGAVDMLHTLAYEGMNVFTGHSTDLAAQLWIGGRYMESLALLLAPLFVTRKVNPHYIMAGIGGLTMLLLLSIFQWDIFPTCFVPGHGLTPFKKISELIIVALLVLALIPLLLRRDNFSPAIPRWIALSIVFTIGSELFFVFYESPFDAVNGTGHFLKLISFYFVYKALIEVGLKEPQAITFHHLHRREQALRKTSTTLQSKLNRKDRELHNAIGELARQTSNRLYAEEELAQSETKYRTLVENLRGIVYISSADQAGALLYISPQVNSMLGCKPKDLIAESNFWACCVHEQDRDLVLGQLRDSRQKQKPFTCEYRLISKKGRHIWVRNEAVPVHNKEGKLLFYQGAMYDISSRKKAEIAIAQARQYAESIVKTIAQPLLVLDESFQAVSANPAFYSTFGLDPQTIKGKSVFDFDVAQWDREPLRQYLDEVCSNQTREPLELAAVFANDDKHIFQISARLVDTGTKTGLILLSAEDITVRKKAEKAVRNYQYQLEKRVNERTAELAESNKDLEAFAYSVSHDLRAPLRAIGGFTRILLEEHSGQLDDEATRLLNIVCENTDRMNELIDGILQISRLGRRQLKKRRLDMQKLSRNVANELCSVYDGKKYDIVIKQMPESVGDPVMIRDVLANFLFNAAKFSSMRPKPQIIVGAETKNGHNVYFVKDNGIGFDMRYHDKIFGVFNRLHSSEEFEGTGVGLANVKRIIQKHKGLVWAKSTPGEGATFYFSLPTENDGHKTSTN